MIIHKLEMYNFRQFIGQQKIEFSVDSEKNVTALIGVNTSGKTTFIRAFEWCLYGKNGFKEQPILLNEEVKHTINVGEKQDVWVAVTFSHADAEGEKLYTLKRKFEYQCTGQGIDNGKKVNEFNKKPTEELSLTYLQSDGQTKAEIDTENISESIDKILPEGLSDYFFFGGERISGIANRKDLSVAVRGLMRLDILVNSCDHIKEALKKFSSSIDTSGDKKAQQAKDTMETAKKKKQGYEDAKINAEGEMEYYKRKEMDAYAKLLQIENEGIKEAQEELNQTIQTIKNKKARLESTIKEYVELFNQRPYAFFGMPAIKKSLELLESMKDQVECVPGMNQDSIDYLINRGRCICGTDLKPDSVPYKLVIQEKRKLPPEAIGAVVSNYKNKAEGYLAGSENFLLYIHDKFKDIRRIKREIGNLQDNEERLRKRIREDVDAKAIEIEQKEAHENYLEAKSDYDKAVSDIGQCEGEIKNCESILKIYAKNSAKNGRLNEYITYAQLAYDQLNGEYIKGETYVKAELQKRVNDNFANMYHGKRTIVIDEKYRVGYSDIKTQESAGLKAVKSFAFIAGLVSMAKDRIITKNKKTQVGQVYPLVMDAPFSNVDATHIENICKILPKTANQVIIAVMDKDWKYAKENLGQYVGKQYIIDKDKNQAGEEIETATHIRLEKDYV